MQAKAAWNKDKTFFGIGNDKTLGKAIVSDHDIAIMEGPHGLLTAAEQEAHVAELNRRLKSAGLPEMFLHTGQDASKAIMTNADHAAIGHPGPGVSLDGKTTHMMSSTEMRNEYVKNNIWNNAWDKKK
jgi:hypothetical protein